MIATAQQVARPSQRAKLDGFGEERKPDGVLKDPFSEDLRRAVPLAREKQEKAANRIYLLHQSRAATVLGLPPVISELLRRVVTIERKSLSQQKISVIESTQAREVLLRFKVEAAEDIAALKLGQLSAADLRLRLRERGLELIKLNSQIGICSRAEISKWRSQLTRSAQGSHPSIDDSVSKFSNEILPRELAEFIERRLEHTEARLSKESEPFILGNMRLIATAMKTIRRQFKVKDWEQDDLYSAGRLALTRAVQGFNPKLGFQFSTYAVDSMKKEMRRVLFDRRNRQSVPVLGSAERRGLLSLSQGVRGDDSDSVLSSLVADKNSEEPSRYTSTADESRHLKRIIESSIACLPDEKTEDLPGGLSPLRQFFGLDAGPIDSIKSLYLALGCSRERAQWLVSKVRGMVVEELGEQYSAPNRKPGLKTHPGVDSPSRGSEEVTNPGGSVATRKRKDDENSQEGIEAVTIIKDEQVVDPKFLAPELPVQRVQTSVSISRQEVAAIKERIAKLRLSFTSQPLRLSPTKELFDATDEYVAELSALRCSTGGALASSEQTSEAAIALKAVHEWIVASWPSNKPERRYGISNEVEMLSMKERAPVSRLLGSLVATQEYLLSIRNLYQKAH